MSHIEQNRGVSPVIYSPQPVTVVEQLQQGLVALHYTRRQVSVRRKPCGYSQSIDMTIRDAGVNFAKVDELARRCEAISRDGGGEILEGGNTYVSIRLAGDVEAAWAATYLPELTALIGGLTADWGERTADGNYVLFLHGRNGVKIWHEKTNNWLECTFSKLDETGMAVAMHKAAQV